MKFRNPPIHLKPGLILHAYYPCKCLVKLIEPDLCFKEVFGWKCKLVDKLENNKARYITGQIYTVFRSEFTDENEKPYFRKK